MSKRSTRSTRSTSTPRLKESKIVFPQLPAGDVYESFAVKKILVKEEMAWHLTEMLKSARKKMVATEAYRNRWTVGVSRVVYKEVFVGMFKIFNGKDRFIEVQKEKYKDGRVKVYRVKIRM